MKLECQVVEMFLIRGRHRLDGTSVKPCPRVTCVDNAVLTTAQLLAHHWLPCIQHATSPSMSMESSQMSHPLPVHCQPVVVVSYDTNSVYQMIIIGPSSNIRLCWVMELLVHSQVSTFRITHDLC